MEEQATDCRLQTADSPDSIKPRTALKQRLAGWVAKRLYKASLKHSRRVFFQNPDDRDAFVKLGLVRQDKTVVVSGSGVDVDHFHEATDRRPQTASFLNYKEPRTTSQKPTPTHSLTHKPTRPQISFLLIARLLRDKGIREYAEAAAMIKRDLPAAEFHLVGCYDPNPSGLKPNEVDAWVKAGTIICHGHQPEVRPFFRNCDVYVLPSYREGTPRTVLEAMATGRAIITTDAPGCRETIRFQAEGRRLKPEEPPLPCETTARHAEDVLYNEERRTNNQELFTIGTNGILIPPRDAESLADAMRFFINNPEQIATMGRESRRYAEERYDVRKVNAVMLKEMGLLETVAGAPVMHPLSVGTHAPAVPPS
jgi:glycosyltransferase involved in cell wall biosynthesis